MRALIDGDTIVYRVGYSSDADDLSVAIHRCDSMLDGILEATKADNYRLFLTDSERNFRRKVWPLYHANRTKEKPRWYGEIKDYLINHWGAEIAIEQEADDALGIEQDKVKPNTVICSIDKDLKQVPGLHYNFVSLEWAEVSDDEGEKWFYKQLLQGDPVDNVQGVPGIGKAKSEKLLKDCKTELELWFVVFKTYHQVFSKMNLSPLEIDELILRNGRLLYIRKRKDEVWNPPTLPQSTIPLLESIPNVEADSIPSTELTTPETMNGYVLHGLVPEVNTTVPDAN